MSMTAFKRILLAITAISLFALCSTPEKEQADLLIINAKIWTGNEAQPWADWVAIKGDKILQTGSHQQSEPDAIESIDMQGKLLLPGFNDSHVHFASAGHLLLNINLLDVNNTASFIDRVRETVNRLPEGSWITRGDWGAYEAWAMGSQGGDTRGQEFLPHRNMIDSISDVHPVLVTKFDRSVGLANALALDYLGLQSDDGLLRGEILNQALHSIPAKSFEQRLAESKRALEECRKWGVTTVQDMSDAEQLNVYEALRKNGELSCRINFAPSRLIEYEEMVSKGWKIQRKKDGNYSTAGDEWISFGTLKTHIDGIMGARTARFYEPYNDNDIENRTWTGGWREFSKDMPSFKEMIIKADQNDIQLRIHAIGDLANAILLDILDSLESINGEKERRFRLVHAQVIRENDFAKLRGRNVVAEVQPYHVTDDMRWMEERIGYERCKGAYAFKTLLENDCVLSFGSDWPGTNASYYPINPMYGLYASVTRQTLNGEPAEGWFPEQRLDLETSLKAYTWGSAYGAFEDNVKGRIEAGKLADLVVLDTDLFNTSPDDWLKAKVNYTIVGGKIVYQSN
jgi:predicted amidohydrolase YtcJ